MRLSNILFSVLIQQCLCSTSHAFTTPSRLSVSTRRTTQSRRRRQGTSPLCIGTSSSDSILGDECIITPEGFGFSAPAGRILKQADRKGGFYKASGRELVIDVMEAITSGDAPDVALVYDDNDKILGLFTESDYIRVSDCQTD